MVDTNNSDEKSRIYELLKSEWLDDDLEFAEPDESKQAEEDEIESIVATHLPFGDKRLPEGVRRANILRAIEIGERVGAVVAAKLRYQSSLEQPARKPKALERTPEDIRLASKQYTAEAQSAFAEVIVLMQKLAAKRTRNQKTKRRQKRRRKPAVPPKTAEKPAPLAEKSRRAT